MVYKSKQVYIKIDNDDLLLRNNKEEKVINIIKNHKFCT
jgi:hypothetical protein